MQEWGVESCCGCVYLVNVLCFIFTHSSDYDSGDKRVARGVMLMLGSLVCDLYRW